LPKYESPAMPYGYPSPTPHGQTTAPYVDSGSTPVKLYHPDLRMEPSSSRSASYHHQGNNWTPPVRGPPPTYNSPHGAVGAHVYAGATPPPVLLPHHSGGTESDAMGNCLCASCNRYEFLCLFPF